MSEKLALKNILDISAYLDGRLDQAAKERFEKRLQEDATFNQAFLEVRHTRKLLRSLPPKHAPRNFTLPAQYARRQARRWGTHSYFGLASAAAALALVVLVGINTFSPKASMMSAPAPAVMLQAESAMDSNLAASSSAPEPQETPLVFNWAPQDQAAGMGGGGGGDAADLEPKAAVSDDLLTGQAEGSMEEPVTIESAPQEVPDGGGVTVRDASTPDPSTLILGLPEPGTEGEVVTREMTEPRSTASKLAIPASSLWMIGLGAVALIFGVLAFILRRR